MAKKVQTGTRMGLTNPIPAQYKASGSEVNKYLVQWNNLPSYPNQESALYKLFNTFPNNIDLDDVLVKVATLNEFYSGGARNIHNVASHYHKNVPNLDQRIHIPDLTVVDDLANVQGDNKLYSLATKYCSFHNPNEFPIYDGYVAKVLKYFQKRDKFTTPNFTNIDYLKSSYANFKKVIDDFITFYGLGGFTYKEIDHYLWQFGKGHFK